MLVNHNMVGQGSFIELHELFLARKAPCLTSFCLHGIFTSNDFSPLFLKKPIAIHIFIETGRDEIQWSSTNRFIDWSKPSATKTKITDSTKLRHTQIPIHRKMAISSNVLMYLT